MALIQYLDDDILEGSTAVITVAYYDDTEAAVTPNAVTWTLREAETGEIVNSRDGESIAAPGTSNDIVLQGDDLTEGDKLLFVEGDYDSVSGSGLPFKALVAFKVRAFE